MDLNFTFPRFISSSFGLSQQIVEKLLKHNLNCENQIKLLSDYDFKKIYMLTDDEILEINQKVKQTNKPFETIQGSKLNSTSSFIKSGSPCFDRAFGGMGLPIGRLTQIAGEAGAGKSQICHQLCFYVQLSNTMGAQTNEALYFDTEKTFRSERICQIANHYYEKIFHDQKVLESKIKEILSRVHVRQILSNSDDLTDIIVNGELEKFLEHHSNIRLFVLDSIAYHFRYDYVHGNDFKIKQLVQISNKLKQLASENKIAVLITNHFRFNNNMALGVLWNSFCSTSLFLKRLPEENVSSEILIEDAMGSKPVSHSKKEIPNESHFRLCVVKKSLSDQHGFQFKYSITQYGIKGTEDNSS